MISTKAKRKAYDAGKKCARTMSPLESARIDQVFAEIGGVLSNGYEIKDRYVWVGDCGCLTEKHRQIKFIVILNTNEISIEMINKIMEGRLSIEFTNIMSGNEGQNSFVILVFTQSF